MRFCALAAFAAVLFSAPWAQAQIFPNAVGYQARASTVGEGHARGLADVTRAASQANLVNSIAAGELEKARSIYLDNRLKGTNTYFEMRRVNRAARAEERPRPTSEQLFRLARENAPKRLSGQELHAQSGALNWPMLLQLEDFSKDRAAIEAAYASRAKNGQTSVDEYYQIQQSTKSMLSTLKKRIRDFPPQQYTTAKTFATRLAYEARFTKS